MHLVRPDVVARHRLRRAGERARRRRLRRPARAASPGWRAAPARGRRARGRPGHGFQRTRSCAHRRSACSSRSATTPTKSRITTTARTPGMCAIDASSTASSVLPMKSPASTPAYGGRTTRPCSMPGTRMSCTKTSSPRRLGRNVDARHRPADDAVVGRRLQRRVGVELSSTCGRAAVRRSSTLRGSPRTHDAVAHVERSAAPPSAAPPLDQPRARLRRRRAQRHRMDLDRRAGDRRALVRRARGVAEHHVHRAERDVELLGDDLRERGADAGAQVDVAVQRGDAAVVPHREQDLGAFGRIGRHGGGWPGAGGGGGRRLARDQQHAARARGNRARVRGCRRARRVTASSPARRQHRAARRTACRISRCVPQRHRLCDSACAHLRVARAAARARAARRSR